MNRLTSGRYWAWIGFVAVAIFWGRIQGRFEIEFVWGAIGTIVLVFCMGALREWDGRANQFRRSERR